MVDRSLYVLPYSLPEVVKIAQEAEAAGFDAVWTIEFYDRDAFVRMAAMGAATSRIRIASGIAYAFVRNPVLTAAGVADLDNLTGGRIVLGLGSGTQRMNESWYGIPFVHPAPRMGETVQLLRALWAARRGPRFKFASRFYQIEVDNYSLPQLQREHIPLYVAGVNPGMIALAGEVADGLVGHPLFTPRYLSEVVHPALARGARKAGRPEDEPRIAANVMTSIADDSGQARHDARRQIAFYATVKTYDRILDLHGWGKQKQCLREAFRRRDAEAMADAVTDDMVDAIAVAGTPEECVAQFQKWDGLIDEALFYSPTFGISPERILENHRRIIQIFARGQAQES